LADRQVSHIRSRASTKQATPRATRAQATGAEVSRPYCVTAEVFGHLEFRVKVDGNFKDTVEG